MSIVTAIDEWPSSSCTMRGCTHCLSNSVAAVWCVTWKRGNIVRVFGWPVLGSVALPSPLVQFGPVLKRAKERDPLPRQPHRLRRHSGGADVSERLWEVRLRVARVIVRTPASDRVKTHSADMRTPPQHRGGGVHDFAVPGVALGRGVSTRLWPRRCPYCQTSSRSQRSRWASARYRRGKHPLPRMVWRCANQSTRRRAEHHANQRRP